MADKKFSRRAFISSLAVAVPAGSAVLQNAALASDLPHLDSNDATAQALAYVHDAANVDTSNPIVASKFQAGQHCANCNLIQGDDGAEWRPCGIFPGKAVNANGWCTAWIAKS
jgi:hypothetical protein